jgi:hypothetical protein
MTKQELKLLEKRWNTLNDEQRWKAIISEPETFKDLIVNLDNDDTFMTLKSPKNEYEEEYHLDFDEYLGWLDGIQELLKAINVNAEPM